MLRLDSREPGFAAAFERVVRDRRESGEDIAREVATIVNEVRLRGDEAVAELTERFDRHRLGDDWRVDQAEGREAFEALDPTLRAALELAAQRIRAFHQAQRPDASARDFKGPRVRSLPAQSQAQRQVDRHADADGAEHGPAAAALPEVPGRAGHHGIKTRIPPGLHE